MPKRGPMGALSLEVHPRGPLGPKVGPLAPNKGFSELIKGSPWTLRSNVFEVLTFINGFIEAKLMVTPTDDDNNRVNIEQSGRS